MSVTIEEPILEEFKVVVERYSWPSRADVGVWYDWDLVGHVVSDVCINPGIGIINQYSSPGSITIEIAGERYTLPRGYTMFFYDRGTYSYSHRVSRSPYRVLFHANGVYVITLFTGYWDEKEGRVRTTDWRHVGTHVSGEYGDLCGKVRDVDTGEDIVCAEVTILDRKGHVDPYTRMYWIRDIPAGTHTATASHPNYYPQSKEVTIEAGTTVRCDFELKEKPPPPAPPVPPEWITLILIGIGGMIVGGIIAYSLYR